MNASRAERLERAIDVAAAAVLAATVGFAALRAGGSGVTVGAVVAAAFLVTVRVLTSIGPVSSAFAIGTFALEPLPVAIEPEELLLTDADRLNADEPSVNGDELLLTEVHGAGSDELVLDDVLAKLGEESRVVRLFDPSAMPTPGELRARIDRHLDSSDLPLLSADASRALHDALAELRRSLR